MPAELTPYALLALMFLALAGVLVRWLRAIQSGRWVAGYLVDQMREDLLQRIEDKDRTIASLVVANDKLATAVGKLTEVGVTSNELLRSLRDLSRTSGRDGP